MIALNVANIALTATLNNDMNGLTTVFAIFNTTEKIVFNILNAPFSIVFKALLNDFHNYLTVLPIASKKFFILSISFEKFIGKILNINVFIFPIINFINSLSNNLSSNYDKKLGFSKINIRSKRFRK
jgi:hypothetical protein